MHSDSERMMRISSRIVLVAAVVCGPALKASAEPSAEPSRSGDKARLEVAAIYFPSWHTDDHYSSWYGEGWNEWELVKNNSKRFADHHTLEPAAEWGYFDEADPKLMARQIDLAADHGIDVFIFDWYWYNGVQMLHRPVEEALPQTPNRNRIRYALMWANHTWVDYFPYPYEGPAHWLLPIRHTPDNFRRVMDHCIEKHFRQPNYWRVDGRLYFSIFAIDRFIEQLGGPEQTRIVLDAAREQVRKAGLGEMHLAAFAHSPESLPAVKAAGFDSTTSYNVITGHSFPDQPTEEYDQLMQRHEKHWKAMDSGVLPHAPVVTLGWDVTPRWVKDVPWPPQKSHYPYTPVVVNDTPEKFGQLLRRGLRHASSSKPAAPFLLINAWNEWTEGCSLLPQVKYGDGYLRELKKALAEEAAPRQ